VPLANSNGESWCMGLDGLDKRCGEYYKAGARFAKWRSVVSIPAGPSMIALRDCAYGLARYAAIAQNAGLVPIVEPEVLLDGDQDIDRCGARARAFVCVCVCFGGGGGGGWGGGCASVGGGGCVCVCGGGGAPPPPPPPPPCCCCARC
jgi:hypothetical protein